MSEENRPKKKPRRHQRRRRPNKNQKSQSKEESQVRSQNSVTKKADENRGQRKPHGQRPQSRNNPQRTQNKNSSRPRRNRNNNRKRKPITTRGVVGAYLETISRYLKARKDYFDSFRGTLNKKVRRTFDNYQKQLKTLRGFEKTLKPWQAEELQKNIEFFPEDNEFSKNHPGEEIAEKVEETEEKVFFHELISQKERSRYAEDTEESEGSIDDYTKYKESLMQA